MFAGIPLDSDAAPRDGTLRAPKCPDTCVGQQHGARVLNGRALSV